MRTAIDRAGRYAACRAFDSIVYVGGAIWDARACLELRIPFVGIAGGPNAGVLSEKGAHAVFFHYAELDAFLAAIDTAGRLASPVL